MDALPHLCFVAVCARLTFSCAVPAVQVDRYAVSEMVCLECATRQPVAGRSCAPLALLLAGASCHLGLHRQHGCAALLG